MIKIIKRSLFVLVFLTISLNARNENIQKAGDIVQILVPISAYGATFYMDDEEGRNQFYKSFFSTVLVTHGLKYTVKEERPDGSNTQSFPSGHTSAAFQGASFIHYRYGLKKAIIPYIAATFVGYSRVYSEQHYLHDVVAGAIIGAYSNYYFVTKYKNMTIKPIAYMSDDVSMYGLNIKF